MVVSEAGANAAALRLGGDRSVTVHRVGPVAARRPPSLTAELDEALRPHLHR